MSIGAQFFKFRPLDRHAIDVLVTRHIFLAPWAQLNDPHEAQLLIRGSGFNYAATPQRAVELEKLGWAPNGLFAFGAASARVCSLARTWSSNLLWSHYADGHQGVAIGIDLPALDPDLTCVDVKYDDRTPIVDPPIRKEQALEALAHKAREWHYEEETRIVTFDGKRSFVEGIQIRDVIFGLRASDADIDLVRKLVGGGPRLWRICQPF